MYRTLSIRTLVAALAVGPVVLLAITMVGLLAASTRDISERLGESLVDNATDNVRADVAKFLGGAVRLSDLYERRLVAGLLPKVGLSAWERPQLDDLVVNPGVASISFGAANGETTWVLRRSGWLEVGRVAADGTATEHRIDPGTGIAETQATRTYSYDPRKRPWYAAATPAGAPVWTPVYFWFGDAGADSETGAGYTRPIRNPDGALAGVLVIDVTLGGLSIFLRSLEFSSTGSIYIVDGQDRLVAASHGGVNSVEGERLSFTNSGQPEAQEIAAAIAQPGFSRAAERTVRVDVGGRPSRARVTPLRPYPGIEWSIITVIPEAAFLADAQALQRRAMMLGGAAVIGALAIAFVFASRISRPLVAVADHVRSVGRGDFHSRLDLRGASELRSLSDELNRMAVSLDEHMKLQQSLEVAMQVQQNLLPSGPPQVAGVDIAGQSKYCDATGGDYYDFIEVSDLPGGRVLIAVGDVMGHGIAAALLMATARAALRAHAWRHGSLGELMDRVNAVLAREARHGRFMTMVLVILDPLDGTMRWASAGHDPPIIFDTQEEQFLDIEGGDLPLGVMEDTHYEEYLVSGLPLGSIVFIGTDGIWEGANAAGDMFGKERLCGIIRAANAESDTTSAAIVERVQSELKKFCGAHPPQDDVTLVVLRLQALPQTQPTASATQLEPERATANRPIGG